MIGRLPSFLLSTCLLSAAAACGPKGSAPEPSEEAPDASSKPDGGGFVPDGGSGSCQVQTVEVTTEGWLHQPVGTTLTYAHHPPASGPHYPIWARYQRYTTPVAPGYWVHNIEHGAIVLLHRSDAPAATVDALAAFYESTSFDPKCGTHRRMVMTASDDLPTPIALVAANHVLFAECIDAQAMNAFVSARRGKGPEDVCVDGAYP